MFHLKYLLISKFQFQSQLSFKQFKSSFQDLTVTKIVCVHYFHQGFKKKLHFSCKKQPGFRKYYDLECFEIYVTLILNPGEAWNGV